MKRLVAISVALLAVLCAPAQAAETSVRFKAVGKAVGPAMAGERYAAYPLDLDTVRVIDPVAHDRQDVEHPPECQLAAVGDRHLVWNCFRPLPYARVLDIAAGTVHVPWFATGSEYTRSFGAVGRHWVAGAATGPGYTDSSFYVNWRTGARRGSSAVGAGSYADLDSPSLTRRLCAPLRRPRSGSYDAGESGFYGDPFEGYQYERPFGLRRIFDGQQFFLELDRCGRRAGQVVAQRPFASENLLAGKISYAKPGAVLALLPRSGRTFKWAVRHIDRIGERSADVRHTARRIFVSVPAVEGPVWRIYSAPWPR